jgi:16S rRNA (cytosine1402-N4)-methyltransferase
VVVDCTIGFGGHASAMLEKIGSDGFLLGIDLDGSTLGATKNRLEEIGNNFELWQGNFGQTEEIIGQLKGRKADILLADLGVNSQQLDDVSRGFSFGQDGPLRMTMDADAKRDAAELVNNLDEKELADLIYGYGQERRSRRIARFIVRARREEAIRTTGRLAEIICRAAGPAARRQRIHPATRTFQALRIAVNGELDNLSNLLSGSADVLKEGGRIGVISFHSLEDGLVKHSFRRQAKEGCLKVLTKSPVRPGEAERRANRRSRSAKFRASQRRKNVDADYADAKKEIQKDY